MIVFRLFYLLIPFALSLLLILLFERAEFARRKLEAEPTGANRGECRRPG